MTTVALITGVSREMGLGFEASKQLAEKGITVIMTARNLESVASLAEKLKAAGHNAHAMQLDIADYASVENAAAEIGQKYGKLDILVNNAGAYYDAGGKVLDAEFDFVNKALDTNLFGAWRTIKGFRKLLAASGQGRVVNVSSGAGSFGDPFFGLFHHPQNVPVYGITKLALNGLTAKASMELKGDAILVNSVCPGWVATYPGVAEMGARPVNEGAAGIVWAATLPQDGPTGGFFRDGQPLSW